MSNKPLVPAATAHTTILKDPDTEQRIGAKVEANVPNMFQDVKDFHKKFGISYDGPPRELPEQEKTFRDATESEEQCEIRAAKDMNQLADLLDGYVDYIYFVLGRCHLQGWDFNEAWRRVHAANMAKELSSEKNPSKRGYKGDIVKPDGWTAPNHQDLVTVKKS